MAQFQTARPLFSHRCLGYRAPCAIFARQPDQRPTIGVVLARRTLRPSAPPLRAQSPASTEPNTTQTATRLADLDALLQKAASGGAEAEDAAVHAAEQLRERGVLRAFGAAQQVPKRAYTLEELRLNKIQPEKFLAPEDNTLSGVRNLLQGSFLVGLTAAYAGQVLDLPQVLQTAFLAFFLLAADQVANQGGVEALLVDSAGRVVSRTYARRVALHEAGHFLVAYLLGLLPRGYTLSSLDAFLKSRHLNVQAGTQLCDGRFQREVASGQLSSSSLDVFCCVALAGVATEWLRYGRAEGGLADVQQLDGMLSALRFTQAKSDSQVRWAVLNVVSLLRRHGGVQDQLADAMARGDSVAECIRVVEAALAGSEDI